MNIVNPVSFGAPDLTLTTSNAIGTGNAIRTGASVALYDATLPDAITYGQSGSVGSAGTASRRDHAHAMAASTALSQASVAEIEAESNVDKYIPPDLIKDSPGVCKAWCNLAGDASINDDYNVASTSDDGAGDFAITWSTGFANTNYAVTATVSQASVFGNAQTGTMTTALVDVRMFNAGGDASDAAVHVIACGEA